MNKDNERREFLKKAGAVFTFGMFASSFAAIINLFTTILLVPIFQEIGTAISVLFTELFVTSSIIIFLRKKGFFSNEI